MWMVSKVAAEQYEARTVCTNRATELRHLKSIDCEKMSLNKTNYSGISNGRMIFTLTSTFCSQIIRYSGLLNNAIP